MTFDELEIGHCYTHHDDGSYKVIDKGSDWVLMWNYSCNHHVAVPWIHKSDDNFFDGLDEETDEWENDVFNNLVYHDYDMLKEN